MNSYERNKRFSDENFQNILKKENKKIIEINYDRYDIKIELTDENKFIQILEVKVKKEFRSFNEKNVNGTLDDVEEFFIK